MDSNFQKLLDAPSWELPKSLLEHREYLKWIAFHMNIVLFQMARSEYDLLSDKMSDKMSDKTFNKQIERYNSTMSPEKNPQKYLDDSDDQWNEALRVVYDKWLAELESRK
jgi:hypothetical protein